MILGLVEVRMWDYLWGMSERQIELLLADQPVTIYLDNDKKGKKGVNDAPPPSKSSVLEAEKKWQEKYGNGEKPKLKLDLNGFSL